MECRFGADRLYAIHRLHGLLPSLGSYAFARRFKRMNLSTVQTCTSERVNCVTTTLEC